jgi:ribosomal protein S18 acetylase RimI-like enzyme
MVDVVLRPLDPARFQQYVEEEARHYSKDIAGAGYVGKEKALSKAREDIARLLPQGIDTPGHHFYEVFDEASGAKIGMVWLKIDMEPRRSAFLYSVYLQEEHRGRGYGKAAMAKVEETSIALGAEVIFLHVFANNEVAIKLYRSRGFDVRSMNMGKELRSKNE